MKEWFTMQKKLDQYIEKKHQLENVDLFGKKILALFVEVGELANETRCFKFWSNKPPSNRSVILEEFVDGVHFILSLGISLNFDQKQLVLVNEQIGQAEDTFELFLKVYRAIDRFAQTKSFADYENLFQLYLALGNQLGFSLEDIQKAYIAKNEVNYNRQDSGY